MKFVIQKHVAEDKHFDLMIETESLEALLTWKITERDMDQLISGRPIIAEKLADHRKEYLTYEGPVSKSRGSVKIFDSGTCRTELYTTSKFRFGLSGTIFNGDIQLEINYNNMFSIQYIPKTQ